MRTITSDSGDSSDSSNFTSLQEQGLPSSSRPVVLDRLLVSVIGISGEHLSHDVELFHCGKKSTFLNNEDK